MRQILVVCRSKKKARPKTARILDKYLWRVGDRTWRGGASGACLERLHNELKKSATVNTSAAVYAVKNKRVSQTPLFIVGSRKRFSLDGRISPIRLETIKSPKRQPQNVVLLRQAVLLAALFHDFGKATQGFQEKLHRSAFGKDLEGRSLPPTEAKNASDPVRHEVFSALIFGSLFFKHQGSAKSFLSGLTSQTKKKIEEEFSSLREKTRSDLEKDMSKMLSAFQESTWVGLVFHLILNHHRQLAREDFTSFGLKDGLDSMWLEKQKHIRSDVPYTPSFSQIFQKKGLPWESQKWNQALKECCAQVISVIQEDGDVQAAPTSWNKQGPHVTCGSYLGRMCLMFADHIGSHQKTKHKTQAPQNFVFANSAEENKIFFPADTLVKHTMRVYQNAQKSCDEFLTAHTKQNGLDEHNIPTDILVPKKNAPSSYQWQEATASLVKEKLSNDRSSKAKGFFAVLTAGTGTGKTRGAPTVLAAAAMNDPLSSRRKLRFNLGVGLNTLSHQTGLEYTKDLNFSADSVATLSGKVILNTDFDKEKTDEDENISGSENRTETYLELHDINTCDENDSQELQKTTSDEVKPCSQFLTTIFDATWNSEAKKKSQKLLNTPVLSATIDHLMLATGGHRSMHLLAMARVLTSDLIIDEVDIFGNEDLTAVARLIYLTALGGRRVIIMSASVTNDISELLFKHYQAGWESYSKLHEESEEIWTLVAGDAPKTQKMQILSVEENSVVDFSKMYEANISATISHLKNRDPLRCASILPVHENSKRGQNFVEDVLHSSLSMHAHHHTKVFLENDVSINMSFGLIKLTRVQHVQDFAKELNNYLSSVGGVVQNRSSNPVKIQWVALHSRLPLILRNWYETVLKEMLTRKSKEYNVCDAYLNALAQQYPRSQNKVKDKLKKEMLKNPNDRMVLVVASPVIETGNDLDFDHAVIDSVDVRSVLQTAGRVNRHRQKSIDPEKPNIAVLSAPSTTVFANRNSESKKDSFSWAYPGPHTPHQHHKNVVWVERTTQQVAQEGLDKSDCFHDKFWRIIDARLCLDSNIEKESPLLLKERDIRGKFFHQCPDFSSYFDKSVLSHTACHQMMLKFRRQTIPMENLFCQNENKLNSEETFAWRHYGQSKKSLSQSSSLSIKAGEMEMVKSEERHFLFKAVSLEKMQKENTDLFEKNNAIKYTKCQVPEHEIHKNMSFDSQLGIQFSGKSRESHFLYPQIVQHIEK